MREGSSAAESKLECLLEQKAPKDHKIVAIPILRLHNLRRVYLCVIHVDNVIRLPNGKGRVWYVDMVSHL